MKCDPATVLSSPTATGFASEVAAASFLCFHFHKEQPTLDLRGKKKSTGSSSKTLLLGSELWPVLSQKKVWLYTEMLAAETIVYQTGNLDRFLAYGPEQHPIVLQIGGNNLKNLAKATQLATPYGYDEINFNCGCLNPRVAGHGCFGVRLMLDLIGLDDHDSYNDLFERSASAQMGFQRKKTAAASMVADDFARQFESGDVEVRNRSSKKRLYERCWWRRIGSIECQSDLGVNIEISSIGVHGDVPHAGRLCEGCRRTGDPKKFMFCKRCDAAYHCYCMQPPHKNVSSGPYFCPKDKLSQLLFVKGNYCPVCLKVYRDSESTPMVCCDICQRWVHCQCDGIRHRGTVVEVFEGSSVVSVALDDGKKNLELRKQGICFVSQKQTR
ncbi:hypothetical protein KY290_003966 [Solanum tuberosum]|uniref:Zinc finger PHD-type domain-containing protein n=1 Tax=Solanum tuberosum TaxID=4113 RepID=A0ABQ7WUD3_SOLTU|nr:hypothetical protein KY290_003966 [Solanum tuberosum]